MTGECVALTYEPGRPTLRYVVVDAAGRAETGPTLPRRIGRWCTMWASLGTSSSCSTCRSRFSRNGFRGIPSRISGITSRPRASAVPRNGDLDGLIWFEAPACYVFHIVNAYEAEGGAVVVDVVRHPRIHEHDRQGPNEGPPVVVRWTLDRARGRLTEHVLDDHGVEFPRLTTASAARTIATPTRRTGGETHVRSGPAYKHDVRSGRTVVHDFGPGHASLEPVFVPRSGATDEDDGYVMAYVFNAERNASDVVILWLKTSPVRL